jgi:hypothetical protein
MPPGTWPLPLNWPPSLRSWPPPPRSHQTPSQQRCKQHASWLPGNWQATSAPKPGPNVAPDALAFGRHGRLAAAPNGPSSRRGHGDPSTCPAGAMPWPLLTQPLAHDGPTPAARRSTSRRSTPQQPGHCKALRLPGLTSPRRRQNGHRASARCRPTGKPTKTGGPALASRTSGPSRKAPDPAMTAAASRRKGLGEGGKGAGGRSHIGHMMACFMDLERAQGSSKCKTHWPVTLSLLSPG